MLVLSLIVLAVSLMLIFSQRLGIGIVRGNNNAGPGAGFLRNAGFIGVVVFFVMLATTVLYVINPGEVGVEVLFGSVQRFSENGLHVKNPLSNVYIFDIKTQREEQKSEGASQDLQLVVVESIVNYRLDASKIPTLYSKVGYDFVHKVIVPSIHECVKAAVALYRVEDIIVKRHEVKQKITEALKLKLENYYVILEDVNIMDIDFSPEFNKVVEEKQIEEQKIKTAEYRRQQAEQDKQRVILEGQGEAEKQRLLKVNTSKEVIDLKWIEKWDGKLPVTMLGSNSVPMVNLGK
ncbi:MAG: prohibitin family protein [Elusimicrobiota bacterium]